MLGVIHNWRDGLSPDATQALAAVETVRQLNTGQFLYHSGDPAPEAFFVRTGRVEVSSVTQDGRRLLVEVMQPGQTLGDLALVGTDLRINDAIAAVDSKVTVLTRAQYERLCHQFPEIAMSMARIMGQRFQMLHARVQDANLLVLHEQLGRCIVRLGVTRGERQSDGSLLLRDVTQDMLADMVGSVRQSVGREVKKMVADGLVQVEYRSLRILDPDRMFDTFARTIDYDPMTRAGHHAGG